MSDTPITNRHVIQFGDGPAKYVYAAVAANLERENAELHKDKERLDWLMENDCLRDWIANGVAYGLNEGRGYIDKAMEESA